MIDIKSRKKRNLIIALVVAVSALQMAAIFSITLSEEIAIRKVTDKSFVLYTDENTTIKSLKADLNGKCNDNALIWIDIMFWITGRDPGKYPGCYRITPKMSVYDLFKTISGIDNKTINLTFNNIRTKDDFAVVVSKHLAMPSDTVIGMLNDSILCNSLGFNTTTITAMFLPDTYEFYHNCTPHDLMHKMKREYDKFWEEDRLKAASDAGLSAIEISTLASIVEEETKQEQEMNRVAGLYINRLRRGIPLQADPTVKFAAGDFSLRRILNKHLETDSPYNTYKYQGLPPGPIRIPSKTAVEAVLNYEKNNYIYMCAKEDLSGRHNFTANYTEHIRNADRYHKAIDKLNKTSKN